MGDSEAARDAAHLHLSFIEVTLREADLDDVAASSRRRRQAPSMPARKKPGRA